MPQPTTTDLAFCELVDQYLERVYRYLRNFTRDEDVARDLAHETFLSLRRQLDNGNSPSEAYVFTTARNAALSNWRHQKNENQKHENVSVEGDNASGIWRAESSNDYPAGDIERNELRLGLEAAVAKLPEDQKSAFLLSEVEGLKYEEIAQIMGIAAGTVASRKHKAARALRAEMKRMGHELF